MESFTCEVEAAINQRPLTWVADELDGFRALRPVDFLLPKGQLTIGIPYSPAADGEEGDEIFEIDIPNKAEDLRNYWSSSLKTLDEFWKIWKEKYLLMLRERTLEQPQHKGPRSQTYRPPNLNEVVLIEDESKPRNLWQLGRVIELFGGKSENQIRTAKLLIPKGKSLIRPISKLYPLEFDIQRENETPHLNLNAADKAENIAEIPVVTTIPENEYKIELRPKKNWKMPISSLFSIIFLIFVSGFNLGQARPVFGSKCANCAMTCLPNGISAKSPQNFNKIEICCNSYEMCLNAMRTNELAFFLPEYILVNDYECWAHFWAKNGARKQMKKYCPAQNACSIMQSKIEWVLNPECFPTWSKIVYGGFFIGLIILICIFNFLFNFFKYVWIFAKILLFPIRLIFKICKMQRSRKNDQDKENLLSTSKSRRSAKFQRRNRRLQKLIGLIPILIFLCIPTAIHGASETHSFSLTNEECVGTKEGEMCKFMGKTLISLLPNGQLVNLLLKRQNGQIFGELELKMDSLGFECLPYTHKFLRSYTIATKHKKSCPLEDSCQADFCEKVRPETKINELMEINGWPGISFCKHSCSFVWCGCGIIPGASCLFYRPYAKPMSNTTYELIRCQDWKFRVATNIKFYNGGKLEGEEDVILWQGMTTKWQNISISLIGGLQPPSSLFNRYFLINEYGAALTDDITTDLFCPNKSAADSFVQCTLLRSACSDCYPEHDQERVECLCRNLILETIMEDPEKQLDLITPNYNFRWAERRILAETHSSTILLTLSFDGLETSLKKSISTCSLNPVSFQGCYNCLSGGEFSYICKSDYGDNVAEIKCGEVNFPAICSEMEEIRNVSVGFNHAEISLNCSVDCGQNLTFFGLEGHLFLLEQKGENWNRNTENTTQKASKWNFPKIFKGIEWPVDWLEIGNFLWTHLPFFIFISIGFVLFLVVFIYCSPAFRLFRIVSRKCLLFAIFYNFLPASEGCLIEATMHPNLAKKGLFTFPTSMDGPFFPFLGGKAMEPAGWGWHQQPLDGGCIIGGVAGPIPAALFPFDDFGHIGFLIGLGASFILILRFFFSNSEFPYIFPFGKYFRINFPYLFSQLSFIIKIPKTAKIMPPINVLTLAARMSEVRYEDVAEFLLFSSHFRAKLMDVLIKYPVHTAHLKSNFPVIGSRITAVGANLLTAHKDSYSRMTVARYFNSKYGELLFPNGPCLAVPGGNSHFSYFPLEVLSVDIPNAKELGNIVGKKTISGVCVGRRYASEEESAEIQANIELRDSRPTSSNSRSAGRLPSPIPLLRGFIPPPPPPPRSTPNTRPAVRFPSPIPRPRGFIPPPPPRPRAQRRVRRRSIFDRVTFILILVMLSANVNSKIVMEHTKSDGNAVSSGNVNAEGNQQLAAGASAPMEAQIHPRMSVVDFFNNPPPPPPYSVDIFNSNSQLKFFQTQGATNVSIVPPQIANSAGALAQIQQGTNTSGLPAPIGQHPYAAMAGYPQHLSAFQIPFMAGNYDPSRPGLNNETIGQLRLKQQNQQQNQVGGNFDPLSDDGQHRRKNPRREETTDESSDDRRQASSRKKGGAKLRVRRQSVSPSSSRIKSNQFRELANALGRAAASTRHAATMLRTTDNSAIAIMANYMADSLTDIKAKLVRDGRL